MNNPVYSQTMCKALKMVESWIEKNPDMTMDDLKVMISAGILTLESLTNNDVASPRDCILYKNPIEKKW